MRFSLNTENKYQWEWAFSFLPVFINCGKDTGKIVWMEWVKRLRREFPEETVYMVKEQRLFRNIPVLDESPTNGR